jgi:hypothetical protein
VVRVSSVRSGPWTREAVFALARNVLLWSDPPLLSDSDEAALEATESGDPDARMYTIGETWRWKSSTLGTRSFVTRWSHQLTEVAGIEGVRHQRVSAESMGGQGDLSVSITYEDPSLMGVAMPSASGGLRIDVDASTEAEASAICKIADAVFGLTAVRLREPTIIDGLRCVDVVYRYGSGRLALGKLCEKTSIDGVLLEARQYVELSPEGRLRGGCRASGSGQTFFRVANDGSLVPLAEVSSPGVETRWERGLAGRRDYAFLSDTEVVVGGGCNAFDDNASTWTFREAASGDAADAVRSALGLHCPHAAGLVADVARSYLEATSAFPALDFLLVGR